MLNPSFSNLTDVGESKYTLVMLVAKRSRQLVDGAEPMVDTISEKPVTIALEELLQGKIDYDSPSILETK